VSARRIQVQLGKAKILVPVCEDEETTRAIAERVTARLKQIEEESDRIDTHAFALQTAFSFATEVHALRGDSEQDTREITLALDKIATRLKEIVAKSEQEG